MACGWVNFWLVGIERGSKLLVLCCYKSFTKHASRWTTCKIQESKVIRCWHVAFSTRTSLGCDPGQLGRCSDSLRVGRSGHRIPLGGQGFLHLSRQALWAHPASYTIGTGSFPWVKRPGRGVDHPHPSRAQVKERVGVYLYSPSGPLWPVLG